MTTLGRAVLQHMAAGAGKMFNLQLNPREAKIFEPAGERLWIRISDLLRHPIGNRIVKPIYGFVEPSAGQILSQLGSEPHLGAGIGKFKQTHDGSFGTLRLHGGDETSSKCPAPGPSAGSF